VTASVFRPMGGARPPLNPPLTLDGLFQVGRYQLPSRTCYNYNPLFLSNLGRPTVCISNASIVIVA